MQTDARLVNPWGIAFDPQGFVAVANAETGSATRYDGRGIPQSPVVTVPTGSRGSGGPTGIVFSGSDDFVVTGPSGTGPSRLVFATEGGTLAAWSPEANPTAAITVVDGGAEERIYKGLALQAGDLEELRPPLGHVTPYPFRGLMSDWNDPFLGALASAGQISLCQIQVCRAQTQEL